MSTPNDKPKRPDDRFTEQERAELVEVSESTEFTDALLKRSEKLRFYELTADPYEIEIFDDYISQISAVSRHLKKLIDLKLEQDFEGAERVGRQVQDGHEIMEALLGELTRIVDRHYREHFGLS